MSPRRHGITVALGWAALVGLASVTPVVGDTTTQAVGSVPVDLVLHAVGYAVLAALLVRAEVSPWAAIVVAAAFGLGVEGVQGLLPYRTRSSIDAVANLAGALCGVVVAIRLATE